MKKMLAFVMAAALLVTSYAFQASAAGTTIDLCVMNKITKWDENSYDVQETALNPNWDKYLIDSTNLTTTEGTTGWWGTKPQGYAGDARPDYQWANANNGLAHGLCAKANGDDGTAVFKYSAPSGRTLTDVSLICSARNVCSSPDDPGFHCTIYVNTKNSLAGAEKVYEPKDYNQETQVGDAGFPHSTGKIAMLNGASDVYVIVKFPGGADNSLIYNDWASLFSIQLITSFKAAPTEGWNAAKTMFYKNGKAVTGVQAISGKYYYFNSKGVLNTSVTGFTKVSNSYYYFNKGVAYTNRVLRVGKRYLYFGADGRYATTTTKYLKSAGKYYYIYKGVALQNRVYLAGGKLRYFGANGALMTSATGCTKVGNDYYFLYKGTAYTNRVLRVGKRYLYFGADGKYATTTTKYLKSAGKYYYIYKGVAIQNRVYLAGGKIRYFGADGAFNTTVNGFKKVNNKFYFFAKGIAYTNKVEYANKQYRYFATNGAFASTKTGLINIGTNSYYLYKGIAIQNKAQNVTVGGKTRLIIAKTNGVLYKNTTFTFNKVNYKADKYGYCTKV